MVNGKFQETEKWIKRILKNKLSITKGIVIQFLMLGMAFGISSEGLGNINNGTGATTTGGSVAIGDNAAAYNTTPSGGLLQ